MPTSAASASAEAEEIYEYFWVLDIWLSGQLEDPGRAGTVFSWLLSRADFGLRGSGQASTIKDYGGRNEKFLGNDPALRG